MDIYDIIIIGGGPGGYNAALAGARAGLKVLLAEQEKLGGVCLNEGCIPSKALLYSAKLLEGASQGEKYGLTVEKASLDQGKVIDRKNKVVRTLVSGVKGALKEAGVTLVMGQGQLLPKTGAAFAVRIGEQQYLSKNVILAAGSRPLLPPIPGLRQQREKGFVLTSKELLDLRQIPASLVVIGGGVIGLEMACYYNAAGARVTVIEMLPKIGGQIDGDIAALLQKNLEKKGIVFHLAAKVTEITEGAVVYEKEGATHSLPAGQVLASLGREPNTADLGLTELGVAMAGKAVETDDWLRTNIPGLYAVGDINGKVMLAHTAYWEGERAVKDILGREKQRGEAASGAEASTSAVADYSMIPGVIYTNPEVAWVGQSGDLTAEQEQRFYTQTISMRFSGRYLAENEGGDGICKLVLDKENQSLVGVHMIANHSTEAITAAAILVHQKAAVQEIKDYIFPHPSLSEILRESIHSLK